MVMTRPGPFLNCILKVLALCSLLMAPAAHAGFIALQKACADAFCNPVVFDFTLTDLGTSTTQTIEDVAVNEIRSIFVSAGDFRLTEIVPSESELLAIAVSGISSFTVDLAANSVDLTLGADDEAQVVFTNANATAVPAPGVLGLLALGLIVAGISRELRAT